MCRAITIWIKIIWLSVSSQGRTVVHLERLLLQKFGKHCNKASVQNVKDWGQTKNAEDINKETVEINDRITSNIVSKLLTQHDYKIRSAGHLGSHVWSSAWKTTADPFFAINNIWISCRLFVLKSRFPCTKIQLVKCSQRKSDLKLWTFMSSACQ